MKKKALVYTLIGVAVLALLVKILLLVWIEPWAEQKIRKELAEQDSAYRITVAQVHVSLLPAQVVLETLQIVSSKAPDLRHDLKIDVAQVRLEGVSIFKALFKKAIDIRRVRIIDVKVNGEILPPSSPPKARPPILAPTDIRIGSIHIEKLEVALGNSVSAKFYGIKKGDLTIADLQVSQKDTLSAALASHVMFDFEEIQMVSADSFYTLNLKDVHSDKQAAVISVNSLVVHPNYTDYDFTGRHPYETDRIEGGFEDIAVHDFSMDNYLKSGALTGSRIEIGKMDLDVFRDKRKPFPPQHRALFQELLYEYPDPIDFDSLRVADGSVVYREHAEEANQPGKISFQALRAKIYNITNDTVYKTQTRYLELWTEALLMGKSRIVVALKAKLYEPNNAFSIDGHLAAMEAAVLNPILEKNGFIFVNSGQLESMHFRFNADDYAAKGAMTLRYHDLNIAIKNKRTDETTGLKEKVLSFLANAKILNANPAPGKEVRTGVIDYQRDPKRFVFNYFVKAVLSGIKSTLFGDSSPPASKEKEKKK